MALTEDELEKIREELADCHNPLFMFDDDCDGLTSFMLLYKYKREGNWVVIKSSPELDEKFMKSVDGAQPDKIFVLDKPMISQEFIDKAKRQIVWIDHHAPQKMHKVKYFNPRVNDDKDSRPVNYWCYKTVLQDKWLALIGCIGDWFLPEFAHDFPDLIPKSITKVEDALFNSKAGRLAKILSFILKGKTKEINNCIKALTKIKDYNEILDQTTDNGRLIYKKFKKINEEYEMLLNSITEKNIDGEFITFFYKEHNMSFTSDLSNELLYKHPDKIIILGREKSGEMKCSIRSVKYKLPEVIKKSLHGINGYGGGHEHACGCCVKIEQFEDFLDNFRREISHQKI